MSYFLYLFPSATDMDIRLDWSVIKRDQISAYTPGKCMGLQIADAVASATFYSVQLSQYGYTESRYIQMLKPVVYHYRGAYLGYGLKFWPIEAEEKIEKEIFALDTLLQAGTLPSNKGKSRGWPLPRGTSASAVGSLRLPDS